MAAATPLMGRLSDRRGRVGQIVWAALLRVAAAGLGFCHRFLPILGLSVLVGLSISVETSSTSAAVADLSRGEMRGSAMGIFGTIMDLGHSAGPLVSGAVVSYLGFKAAFLGAALVLAAAAVFAATAFDKLQLCVIGKQR